MYFHRNSEDIDKDQKNYKTLINQSKIQKKSIWIINQSSLIDYKNVEAFFCLVLNFLSFFNSFIQKYYFFKKFVFKFILVYMSLNQNEKQSISQSFQTSMKGSSHYPQKNNGKLYSKQEQMQFQDQRQIVDQNYANHSLMMTLSTIESLQQLFQKSSSKFQDKRFSHYDKYDYSSKNLLELKEQLQTHIMGIQVSRKSWQKTYGPGTYTLPNTFNQARLDQQLQMFLQYFSTKDQDCFEMVKDLRSICFNEKRQLYIHKVDFCIQPYDKNYVPNQAEFIKNVTYASDRTRELKQQTQQLGVNDPRNLPTHVREREDKYYQEQLKKYQNQHKNNGKMEIEYNKFY